MPSIPFQYYLKELPDQPLFLPSGQKVPWDVIDPETGVFKTDDAGLIFQLSNAAANRVGGVVRIDEAQYEELKKNRRVAPVNLPPPERHSLPQAPLRVAPALALSPAEAAKSDVVAEVAKGLEGTPPPVTPPPVVDVQPPARTVRRGKLKAS